MWHRVGKQNFVITHCQYINCKDDTIFHQYSDSKPIQTPELQAEFNILDFKGDITVGGHINCMSK
jgi:hypothetical protein